MNDLEAEAMARALEAGDVTPEAQPAVADMIRALVIERDALRAQLDATLSPC
jgi:hypothetical protein